MPQEECSEDRVPAGTGPRAIIERPETWLVGAVDFNADISALWERFSPRESAIQHRVEGAWWEVHAHSPDQKPGDPYSVMVGVEVTRIEAVPDDLYVKPLPAGHYAVFPHRPGQGRPNHGYDDLNKGIEAWLARGPYRIARPFSLQLYDARFKGMDDPESEEDLLIPVELKAEG